MIADRAVLVGTPVAKGIGLSVALLLGLLAVGWGEAELQSHLPDLTREDLSACLAYAHDLVADERVSPSTAECAVAWPTRRFLVVPQTVVR
jgi:uncharacterized protein (DUF433 family)